MIQKRFISQKETFECFGGQKEFIDFHNYYHEEKKIQKYIFE